MVVIPSADVFLSCFCLHRVLLAVGLVFKSLPLWESLIFDTP